MKSRSQSTWVKRDFPSHGSQPLIQCPIHKTFKMLHSLSSCLSLRGTDILRLIPDCWLTHIHWYNSIFTGRSLLLLMYDRQVDRLTSEQTGGVKMRRSASSTETWHKVVMVADWESYNYLCLVSNAWVVFSGALYSVYTPAMACAPSHFWLNCGELLQCMRNYSVCVFVFVCVSQVCSCVFACFTVIFRSSLNSRVLFR